MRWTKPRASALFCPDVAAPADGRAKDSVTKLLFIRLCAFLDLVNDSTTPGRTAEDGQDFFLASLGRHNAGSRKGAEVSIEDRPDTGDNRRC